MVKAPSASELAAQFKDLERRHKRLAAAFDEATARYAGVTSQLQAKRHALDEENRLCKHESTRRAYRTFRSLPFGVPSRGVIHSFLRFRLTVRR